MIFFSTTVIRQAKLLARLIASAVFAFESRRVLQIYPVDDNQKMAKLVGSKQTKYYYTNVESVEWFYLLLDSWTEKFPWAEGENWEHLNRKNKDPTITSQAENRCPYFILVSVLWILNRIIIREYDRQNSGMVVKFRLGE